jgi:hypothetical protein
LNTHKVPFIKMWSKYLVPVPKDWGDHVDVVGFFMDKKQKGTDNKNKNIAGKVDQLPLQTTTSTSTTSVSSIPSSNVTSPPPPPPPLISADSSAYQPSDALREFLESGPPPVFVGFGSMVVEDAASLIQVSPKRTCMYVESLRCVFCSVISDITTYMQ